MFRVVRPLYPIVDIPSIIKNTKDTHRVDSTKMLCVMASFLDDTTTRKQPDATNVVRDGCANVATFRVTQSHKCHVSQFNRSVGRETTRKCTPEQTMLQREN